MTYGELKRQALMLISQYSIAGTTVPASYNNQADYIMKIPLLVDSAEMEIATTVKPIIKKKVLRSPPHDAYRIISQRKKGNKTEYVYHAFPKSVGAEPEDDLILENTPETHPVIALYVAAHLVLDDDTYKYASLYSEYRTKLAELKPPVFITKEDRQNVYKGREPYESSYE